MFFALVRFFVGRNGIGYRPEVPVEVFKRKTWNPMFGMLMKLLIWCGPWLMHRRERMLRMGEHCLKFWKLPVFQVPGSCDWKQTHIRSTHVTTCCQAVFPCVSLSINEILFGPRTSYPHGPVAESAVDGLPQFRPDQTRTCRVLVSHHLRLCQMRVRNCHTKLQIEQPFATTLKKTTKST